ncbi:hypothetical protein ACWGID_34590 [Kribbella sp. NPDC054772]
MTDDLSTKFAVLTEDRPEPADPAVAIRRRIKRRRQRRRTVAASVTAVVATAAVVVTSSVLGQLHSAEPGVATSPTAKPSTRSTTLEYTYTPLPEPWSEEAAFTKQPESLKYAPAFYVTSGSIPNESWAVAAYNRNKSCLIVTDEGPAKSFGGANGCSADWPSRQGVRYQTTPANVPNLGSPANLTLIMGAVSVDARTVRITAGGKSYTAPAVGTPVTTAFRFFALVVPAGESDITAVTATS